MIAETAYPAPSAVKTARIAGEPSARNRRPALRTVAPRGYAERVEQITLSPLRRGFSSPSLTWTELPSQLDGPTRRRVDPAPLPGRPETHRQPCFGGAFRPVVRVAFRPAVCALTLFDARATPAPARAIVLASRAAWQGTARWQASTSPRRAPHSSLPSSRSFLRSAGQGAWSPNPSPWRPLFRPGSRPGNALLMVEYRLAVRRRQFPAAEYPERVWMRPAHYCGDLVSGADRKRANVLSIDGKRQRPFVPKLCELLSVVFDAAISFDPKRHVRSHNSGDTT